MRIYRWHSAWKFSKMIIYVLGHGSDTFLKFLAINLCATAYSSRILPGARCVWMKGPAGTELPPGHRFHGSAHVGIVRRAMALKNTR